MLNIPDAKVRDWLGQTFLAVVWLMVTWSWSVLILRRSQPIEDANKKYTAEMLPLNRRNESVGVLMSMVDTVVTNIAARAKHMMAMDSGARSLPSRALSPHWDTVATRAVLELSFDSAMIVRARSLAAGPGEVDVLAAASAFLAAESSFWSVRTSRARRRGTATDASFWRAQSGYLIALASLQKAIALYEHRTDTYATAFADLKAELNDLHASARREILLALAAGILGTVLLGVLLRKANRSNTQAAANDAA
jgi:hypothetical protein